MRRLGDLHKGHHRRQDGKRQKGDQEAEEETNQEEAMSKTKNPKRIEIETFRTMDNYTLGQYREAEPSCWNRVVSVRKYRLIIEPVDEPDEVIAERLVKLWRNSTNHHDMMPLSVEAKRIGLKLETSEWGKDAPKRTTY